MVDVCPALNLTRPILSLQIITSVLPWVYTVDVCPALDLTRPILSLQIIRFVLPWVYASGATYPCRQMS
jgi:hypothetical protein